MADNFVLRRGETVGSYIVDGMVGAGSSATVWRVHHALLGTTHVLKLVHDSRDVLHKRMWFEGLVHSKLQHPNVVEIREMLVHRGWPGLVLEYVDGPSLEERLCEGPMSVREADAIAMDMLRGVRAAHAAGVVHRDLKPANILLGRQGQDWTAKVGDFGLARDYGAPSTGLTRVGRPLGTPRYMAPEQFENAHSADERADLFSLGCVLYEMLAGQPAFPGDNLLDLHDRIRAGAYVHLQELRSDLPPRMLEAVERCLRVDRTERPVNCDELLALWCGYHRSPRGAWLREDDPTCPISTDDPLEEPTWIDRGPTSLFSLDPSSVRPALAPAPPRAPSRLVVAAVAVALLVATMACAMWAQSTAAQPPEEDAQLEAHA
jgi:serine/threonine protein kinase